jgi:ribulose-5-phosphate 4-epimerase/fuculose-1-phosphate aldolase
MSSTTLKEPPSKEASKAAMKMADMLGLPKIPVFSDPIEERRHRKERLAAAFRLFSKFGFDDGVAGHITARDPVDTDSFWVNPFGVHFSQIRVSDLVRVDEHGVVVEGRRGINPAAFAIHSRVHVARPDVVAAAHAHSVYGKTWSSLGRLLDPITQDACAFYDDHGLFTDYKGVVLDNSEGDGIARAMGKGKAVILQNHGLLTVGQSVDEAAWFFIMMERSCQCQLLAEAAGNPISIPDEAARIALSQVGSHESGWFQFQPLWDRITREQPDLFD